LESIPLYRFAALDKEFYTRCSGPDERLRERVKCIQFPE
jgi:hypothetical protein